MNIAAKIQSNTVPLDQLKPGHEFIGGNINSRTTGRLTDIEQLAASIHNEPLMFTYDRVQTPANIALLVFTAVLWAAFGWRYALAAVLGGVVFSIRRVRP